MLTFISPWAWMLVIAPVLEEWVFRAGLQEWLIRRAWRVPVVIAVSAAAFAAAHAWVYPGWTWLLLLMPGAALALLYQRTRSVCWCIGAHSAMNGVWWLWNA